MNTNPTQSVDHSGRYGDEIDLRQLFGALVAHRWLILSATAAAALIATLIALWLPNIYRAEALLVPNESEGSSDLSDLAAQYGGLASLAGIDLKSGSTDKAALGIEVLKSRKFITEFIQRHDILVPLMASTSWDSQKNALRIDQSIYDAEAGEWVRRVSAPKSARPSLQEAYDEFSEHLVVNEDSQSGFITVSVEHVSPHVAKRWVDWLVEDLNATMMAKDVSEAQQAIDYLNQQIAATSIADLQSVFFRLIEEQTKTIMLARVSPEYLFTTIDPAIAPEEKAKPSRLLISLLGAFVGLSLGILFALTRRP